MITELNIVQAYEMLKVAQAAAYETGEAAIEAKNTLELKRLEGLADGTISGKNQAMRDAAAAELLAADYAAGLSNEHRMLVVLKKDLYGGAWEPMLDDLQNRLAGKPYIFKLVNRIKDDVDRIEEMRRFEAENNVDLGDYVEL